MAVKRLNVTMVDTLWAKAQARMDLLCFNGLSDYLQNLVRDDVQGVMMRRSDAYKLAVECFQAGRLGAGLPSTLSHLEEALVAQIEQRILARVALVCGKERV